MTVLTVYKCVCIVILYWYLVYSTQIQLPNMYTKVCPEKSLLRKIMIKLQTFDMLGLEISHNFVKILDSQV